MKRATLFFCLMVLAGSCRAIEMPPSAKEIGCTNCHAIDRKVVGPAWIEVSKRYRDRRNDHALIDQLVRKVSVGGQGNWGDLPMAANDPTGKKRDKIVELVKFVLALSDQPAEDRVPVASQGDPAAGSP